MAEILGRKHRHGTLTYEVPKPRTNEQHKTHTLIAANLAGLFSADIACRLGTAVQRVIASHELYQLVLLTVVYCGPKCCFQAVAKAVLGFKSYRQVTASLAC
jgi:hypothetical protein